MICTTTTCTKKGTIWVWFARWLRTEAKNKFEWAIGRSESNLHEERNDLSLICTKKGMIWVWSARRRRTEEERLDDLSLICRKKNAGSEWMWGRRSKTRVFKTQFLKVKLKSYKLEFHVHFLPHQLPPLTNRDLKTRVLPWNLNFRHSRC